MANAICYPCLWGCLKHPRISIARSIMIDEKKRSDESCEGPAESRPTPEDEGKAEAPATEEPGFLAEEYRSLRDDLPWRDLYPGLPTVEAARQQGDPVFWAKADDSGLEYVDNQRREELYSS